MDKFAFDLPKGITMTAPGFYGPQGRNVRSQNIYPDLIKNANSFEISGRNISNLEMETAGIYALSNMFGHHAISINAILASRVNESFSKNPQQIVDNAIKLILDRI
jgi:uridine phosphorylase